MTLFNNQAIRESQEEGVQVVRVYKRKLRTWVKVAAGMVVSSVLTTGVLFGATTTDFVKVEVQPGDTTCSIVEGLNGAGTCEEYMKHVYNDNAVFSNERRSVSDIEAGEVLTFRKTEKRFIK